MLDDKKIAIIKERVRLSYSEMHNFKPLTLPAKELKNGERNLNSYTCVRQLLKNKLIKLAVLVRSCMS